VKYKGIARIDKKTKNLVKRLKTGDIAIIDHEDIDRVTAESLVEARVDVVINAARSISGRYPNLGPIILAEAGIHVIDNAGQTCMTEISEGDRISINKDTIIKNQKAICRGQVLTTENVTAAMEKAKANMGKELEKFAQNTLEFIEKEKNFFEGVDTPPTTVSFKGRHALVVARGYDYKADLKALRAYISEFKPVLLGVDGGADALIETGYKPDIIIGDMDSVSEKALSGTSELIVHAFPDGRAPGEQRLNSMSKQHLVFKSPGTSEDVAMLLAYEKGAELIVAVGSHANMVEFLDKGRKGMASTFLVRLRIGPALVDAKGVNKLYRATVKPSYVMVIVLAAVFTLLLIIQASPPLRDFTRLLLLKVRFLLGI
jgi:uncharacterized membrane-anchored protein